jgi:hypothetical protein
MSANTTLDKLLADVPLLTKTLNYHIVPGVAMVPISGVRTGSLFATALGPQSQILVDNTWVACAWLARCAALCATAACLLRVRQRCTGSGIDTCSMNQACMHCGKLHSIRA